MKKRQFLKTILSIGLIPIVSVSQIALGADNLISKNIKSDFIESDGWIVKPSDIKSLQNTLEPSNSLLYEVKKTYHSLKYRYKAAKKSFMNPN